MTLNFAKILTTETGKSRGCEITKEMSIEPYHDLSTAVLLSFIQIYATKLTPER